MRGYIFALILMSSNLNALELNEQDIEYVCGELKNIKEELDNAYCHSSNAGQVKEHCEMAKSYVEECHVESSSMSVVNVAYSFKQPGEEQKNTEKSDHVNESLPGLTLKCINSIKNTWHCGYGSTSYYTVPLSQANQELKDKLVRELFDAAESSISKL